MAKPTPSETDLVVELNDLLQLDHDAVQAYTLAASLLASDVHRRTIESYRADHERHVRELTRLVEARGGTPAAGPHASSPLKLALQAAGRAGGDRGVLIAFKANERQSRDKYRRVANRAHPEDVALVLERAARDEATHYAWVSEALEELGVHRSGRVGRAAAALERPHARAADTLERTSRGARQAIARARRAVHAPPRRGSRTAAAGVGLTAAVVVAGVGLLASRFLTRR